MSHEIEREIKLSAPLDSLTREVALNIFRTEQVLSQALEQALRPFELRLDEFNVLRILRGAGTEGHERTTIEERMVHDPDHLLGLLHRLRQRDLLEGTIRLRITETGRALLTRADPFFYAAMEERIGGVPAADLRVLVSVLERIRRAGEP